MATSHIGRLLKRWVEEEVKNMGLDMAHGAVKDIETYREYVGVVKGMERVITRLEEIEGED